ncbi:regulator of microtubule dynamics protein 1-like isoform X1 [Neodiprion fabricii]|uniref:regulator of microtubule dynamics protein 1-like isoform X1 n=2 Tax=Neodiprion fabricii TaxID=2872261 RepID=UPI001ED92724|nr:regulator of microtubule dynamics protein 1-like isoform X1 [Neodiprion fabricii]
MYSMKQESVRMRKAPHTMSDINSPRLIATAVAAAFGVIGAVGLFVYQKIREQQQTERVRRDLDKMGETMAELQAQLDLLRLQQNQRRNRERISRRKPNLKNSSTYSATDNDTDVDAFSTADTEFDDDEFFDFSDMESGDGDNERISGPTNELDRRLAETDKLIEASELRPGSECEEALSTLRNLLVKYPDNIEVIWRLARACHRCSTNATETSKKLALIVEGLKPCERFEEADSADFHKWYAILIGSHGMFLSTKEKIEGGYRFKKHLNKALEIRPEDPVLHHLSGRFKFEVAGLTWIERKVASTLFAEPPSATYEEAIVDFERAEELTIKPFKDNKLLLGKCYVAVGRYQDAIRWFEETSNIPTVSEEDRVSQNEADQLLSKYSKYRS